MGGDIAGLEAGVVRGTTWLSRAGGLGRGAGQAGAPEFRALGEMMGCQGLEESLDFRKLFWVLFCFLGAGFCCVAQGVFDLPASAS